MVMFEPSRNSMKMSLISFSDLPYAT